MGHKHRSEFDYFCLTCWRAIADAEIVGWTGATHEQRPCCPRCGEPCDCVPTPPVCMDETCPDFVRWVEKHATCDCGHHVGRHQDNQGWRGECLVGTGPEPTEPLCACEHFDNARTYATAHLRLLLGGLRDLLNADPVKRRPEVARYIWRCSREHPQFKKLAFTMVLLAEMFEKELEGEAWKELCDHEWEKNSHLHNTPKKCIVCGATRRV